MLGGEGGRGPGHASLNTFDKIGDIWCVLNVSKYVSMNLKISTFKDNN